MTNTIAAIVVLLATNWTEIGTFTDRSGSVFKVEEGRQVTNTVAVLEFENQEHRFTLKSESGPTVGERKVLLPNTTFVATNRLWKELLYTNIIAN